MRKKGANLMRKVRVSLFLLALAAFAAPLTGCGPIDCASPDAELITKVTNLGFAKGPAFGFYEEFGYTYLVILVDPQLVGHSINNLFPRTMGEVTSALGNTGWKQFRVDPDGTTWRYEPGIWPCKPPTGQLPVGVPAPIPDLGPSLTDGSYIPERDLNLGLAGVLLGVLAFVVICGSLFYMALRPQPAV